MDFGQKVKELRLKGNVTQRELAKALGVDFTYISKIENGKLENLPSEDLIRRIAALLQADQEDLLDLAGKLNFQALQKVATEQPTVVGVLLRRIQEGLLTVQQLEEIKDIVSRDK